MQKLTTDALVGHLGQDAGTTQKSDGAFFDWIGGTEEKPTDMELFGWLVDELKDEANPEEIRSLLRQWHAACEPEEFTERLQLLSKLMPPKHPFHEVKKEFA